MINKKGISPLIATVLLIGFTIVLAALVIRWGSELVTTLTQEQSCQNEATISCTSDVEFTINTATLNTLPVDSQKLTVSLVSNGKKDITAGWIVRIHKDNGEIEAQTEPGNADPLTGNYLMQYSTRTFDVTEALTPDDWTIDNPDDNPSPPGPTIPSTDFNDCTGKFCGVSLLPIITHTTSKGDTCQVTCSQSEQRKELTTADIEPTFTPGP